MSKIWSAVYTDLEPDGAATVANANGVVVIPASQAALVRVDFPYEARIGRVVCKQLSVARDGGAAVGYKIAVYNRAVVPVGVGVAQATLPDNAALFMQYPTQTKSAGDVLAEFVPADGGDGYLFANGETGPSLRNRYCYVHIAPVGAVGESRWEFALDAVVNIGG